MKKIIEKIKQKNKIIFCLLWIINAILAIYVTICTYTSAKYGYTSIFNNISLIGSWLVPVIHFVLDKLNPPIKITPRLKWISGFILIILLAVLAVLIRGHAKQPEIVEIKVEKQDIDEDNSTFYIQIFTNRTAYHVVLTDNQEKIMEIDQYKTEKNKRVFSASVALDSTQSNHILSGYILLPDGAIIESEKQVPVNIPLTLNVTYGEYTGTDFAHSILGTNVQFKALTNRSVSRIDMEWVNPLSGQRSDTMKSDDNVNWVFYAIFQEKGKYSIKFTATDMNGNIAEQVIHLTWPLKN